MARTKKSERARARKTRKRRISRPSPTKRRQPKGTGKNKRKPAISNAKLERGLRVLRETNDVSMAARSIRVSTERFKRAAARKGAIRKQKGRWTVVASLPRRMAIFTNRQQLAITVRSRSASVIGKYNSAVGEFLRTNDPSVLAPFRSRTVKDVNGKSYLLETAPNALYRLSSGGSEPFEDIYRIVLH